MNNLTENCCHNLKTIRLFYSDLDLCVIEETRQRLMAIISLHDDLIKVKLFPNHSHVNLAKSDLRLAPNLPKSETTLVALSSISCIF